MSHQSDIASNERSRENVPQEITRAKAAHGQLTKTPQSLSINNKTSTTSSKSTFQSNKMIFFKPGSPVDMHDDLYFGFSVPFDCSFLGWEWIYPECKFFKLLRK